MLPTYLYTTFKFEKVLIAMVRFNTLFGQSRKIHNHLFHSASH
jgi:hypothetical protein